MSKYPTNFKKGDGWVDMRSQPPPALAYIQIAFVSVGSQCLSRGIAHVTANRRLVWADCPTDGVDVEVTHWKPVDDSPLSTLDTPPRAPWVIASNEPPTGEEVEIIYQNEEGTYMHGFAYTRFYEGDEDIEEGIHWRWNDSHIDPGDIIGPGILFWKPMDPLP